MANMLPINGQHIGMGLMGAGGALFGASLIPQGAEMDVLPPGTPSSAMMVGGMGMMGLGSAITLINSTTTKK